MPQLEYSSGDHPPIQIGEAIVIGRSPDHSGMAIDDKRLSRKHCEIRRQGPVFIIKDLDSRNGTRVNGETVSEKPLKHGDEISLGGFILKYVESGVEAKGMAEYVPNFDESGPVEVRVGVPAKPTTVIVGAKSGQIGRAHV